MNFTEETYGIDLISLCLDDVDIADKNQGRSISELLRMWTECKSLPVAMALLTIVV
jgi:hypothetical protein